MFVIVLVDVTSKRVRKEALLGRESKRMQRKQKSFKYLGSVISENGGCEEEARHRVGAGWGSGEKCQE